MWYLIVLAIWAAGLPFAWKVFKKWKHGKSVKVVFTVLWPLLCLLYGIHCIANLKKEEDE